MAALGRVATALPDTEMFMGMQKNGMPTQSAITDMLMAIQKNGLIVDGARGWRSWMALVDSMRALCVEALRDTALLRRCYKALLQGVAARRKRRNVAVWLQAKVLPAEKKKLPEFPNAEIPTSKRAWEAQVGAWRKALRDVRNEQAP